MRLKSYILSAVQPIFSLQDQMHNKWKSFFIKKKWRNNPLQKMRTTRINYEYTKQDWQMERIMKCCAFQDLPER